MRNDLITNPVLELMKSFDKRPALVHTIQFELNDRMNKQLNEYAQIVGISKNEAAKNLLIEALQKIKEHSQEESWL